MKARLPLLDSIRGFALFLMLGYHFSFDLNSAGAASIDFQRPVWLAYRALILLLFLGVAGMGIFLAGKARPRRVLRLAGCAATISCATWWLFPDTWVFFGILHFIVVASLVGPMFARVPRACLPAGIALVAAPFLYRSSAFNGGLLQLTGLALQLPRTVDFVPLCPWLGVVLLGIFVGSLIQGKDYSWLQAGDTRLAALGRHTLLFYMTHQMLLLPLAWLIARALHSVSVLWLK